MCDKCDVSSLKFRLILSQIYLVSQTNSLLCKGHQNYPLLRRIPFSGIRDVCIEDMRQKQKSRAIFRPFIQTLDETQFDWRARCSKVAPFRNHRDQQLQCRLRRVRTAVLFITPKFAPLQLENFCERKSNFGREFRELNYHIETGRFYDKEIALR